MPEPSLFRQRPTEVIALQWTGDNIAEMEAFAGPAFSHDPGAPGLGQGPESSLLCSLNSNWAPLYPGTWVVRAANGAWSKLTSAEFEARFEAAGDGAGMLTASGVCTHPSCVHTDQGATYRMVGTCSNCLTGPLLMLFTIGHDAGPLKCPVCGVYQVRATRSAAGDEVPAPEGEAADA